MNIYFLFSLLQREERKCCPLWPNSLHHYHQHISTIIITYLEPGWCCRTSIVSPGALILPDRCSLPRVRISKGVATASLRSPNGSFWLSRPSLPTRPEKYPLTHFIGFALVATPFAEWKWHLADAEMSALLPSSIPKLSLHSFPWLSIKAVYPSCLANPLSLSTEQIHISIYSEVRYFICLSSRIGIRDQKRLSKGHKPLFRW